jgi:hypothetical protein
VIAEGAGIVSPGEWILNVSLYTITSSLDYEAPVGDCMTAFLRADFPYTGRFRG